MAVGPIPASQYARLYKAGPVGVDGIELLQAWTQLTDLLPPKHHVMLTGPWSDGHLVIHVVDQTRQPSHVVCRVRGDTLTQACSLAAQQLRISLQEAAAVATRTPARSRDRTGRYVREDAPAAQPAFVDETVMDQRNRDMYEILKTPEGKERFDALMAQMTEGVKRAGGKAKPDPEPEVRAASAPGFTRDMDLVAHLVYKNARVSQYELRHQYGIKNPAQAINDAEAHYNFTMETGGALPNGDIPYRLVGASPAVEGTLPMFVNGIEDPDEKFYVLELDLYNCIECNRHPVFRPQKTETGYVSVCPRHGPATFTRI